MRDNIQLKELKDYFIDNEITKIFKTISFERYCFFLAVVFRLRTNFDFTEYTENKEEPVCIKLLEHYDNKVNKELQETETQKLIKSAREIYSNFFAIPYFTRIKSRLRYKTNNLVMVQCPCSAKNFSDFSKVMDTDFLLFPWKGYDETKYLNLIEKLENDEYHNYRLSYVMKIRELFNMKVNKRKTIIIKLAGFKSLYYPYSYSQIKFPEWISTITYALRNLEIGGDLFLSLKLIKFNPAYKKLFELILQHFESSQFGGIERMLDYGSLFILRGFDGRISEKTIKRLEEISLESLKYTYDTCDYFNYMYRHPEINFYLDDLNFKDNTKNKNITLVDDINLETTSSTKSKPMIKKLENYFDSQINRAATYVNRMVSKQETGKIVIDDEFFYSFIYGRVLRFVDILYQNNIPFSQAFLVYIDKFNYQMIMKLFSYSESSYQITNDFINKDRRPGSYNLNNFQIYTFEKLDNQQILIKNEAELSKKHISYLEQKKFPKLLTDIFDEYKVGIPEYANKNLNLEYKVTESFTKLWEIYKTYPFLIRKRQTFNSYHFGDNPEEFIYCTQRYLEQKKYNTKNIWYGTALKSKTSDTYKYIKKYPGRWLFGSDKTGNITLAKNIEWYRRVLKFKNPLNLITCDTVLETKDITSFQRYEFAKMLMVLSGSSKNTNCVIRHRLPFQPGVKDSEEGNGFFSNMMYVYYYYFENIKFYRPVTSSSVSQDFYIIGENFRGIEEETYQEFSNILKDFKRNICFYTRSSISEYFLEQISQFIKSIYDVTYDQYQLQVVLMTCLSSDDPKIKEGTRCNLIFDKSYTDEIQKEKFKEWFTEFNLTKI